MGGIVDHIAKQAHELTAIALDKAINEMTDDNGLAYIRERVESVRVETDNDAVLLTMTYRIPGLIPVGTLQYRGTDREIARFIDGYVARMMAEAEDGTRDDYDPTPMDDGREWPQAENE